MQAQERLSITMYTRPGCEDSDMAREWLSPRGIPFTEINIDDDDEADRFVRQVNRGFRSTPTLVFGADTFLLVEPGPDELAEAVTRAGYRA